MCSQPWCDFLLWSAYQQWWRNLFHNGGSMGLRRRGCSGHLPPWKLRYEPNMSRKPKVNSLIPILIELIFAMTVYFPLWNSHRTRAKFTVLVSCRDELLTVRSRPPICLQRQVAKLRNGLFYYWPLLGKNNMATNLQRFNSSCKLAVIGVFLRVVVERRHLSKQCSETVTADSSKPNGFILREKKQGRKRAGKWREHFPLALL